MPRTAHTISLLILALGFTGCAEYTFADTETPPAADTDVATDTEPEADTEAEQDPEDETDNGSSDDDLDPNDDDLIGVPEDTDADTEAEPDPEDDTTNGSSGGSLDTDDEDPMDPPDDTDDIPADDIPEFTACVGPHSGQAVEVTLGFPYPVTGSLSNIGLLEGSSNGIGHTIVDVDVANGTVDSNGLVALAGNGFVGSYDLNTCSVYGVKSLSGFQYDVSMQRD